MDSDSFENKMRENEYFHNLRILPGAWVVIRVDGRGFSKLTESRFEKPFDLKFHEIMVKTTEVLFQEVQGIYAYTESDEISVLCAPNWDFFDRSVEKVVSISAGIASATFTHLCQNPVTFDSRVWLGVNKSQVIDYLCWRQADAARCALNGWCYWTLRKAGKSIGEATLMLEGKSVAFKNDLLFEYGINFNDLPTWQRRGIGLYWGEYEKAGYNPISQQAVVVKRRRIEIDRELQLKEAYAELIRGILASNSAIAD